MQRPPPGPLYPPRYHGAPAPDAGATPGKAANGPAATPATGDKRKGEEGHHHKDKKEKKKHKKDKKWGGARGAVVWAGVGWIWAEGVWVWHGGMQGPVWADPPPPPPQSGQARVSLALSPKP